MKKTVTAILTVIIMVFILPVTASAAEDLKAPTVQYRLINRDKISLRWNKIEGADKYYVYKQNNQTGEYIKIYSSVSNCITIRNMQPDKSYSFTVRAVWNGEKETVGESSNIVNVTMPNKWKYEKKESEGGISQIIRYDLDSGESKTILEDDVNVYVHNQFFCHEGSVYYFDNIHFLSSDNKSETNLDHRLYKIDSNGENKQLIADEIEFLPYEDEVNLYFTRDNKVVIQTSGADPYGFYGYFELIETDGSVKKIKGFTEWVGSPELLNDKLYYTRLKEGSVLLLDDIEDKYVLNNGTPLEIILCSLDIYTGEENVIKEWTYKEWLDYFKTEVDLDDGSDIIYYNSFMYYLTNRDNAYYIERFSHLDGEFEVVCRIDKPVTHMEIQNDYIYADCCEGEKYFYYRVKTDGTGLTKRSTPFEWRY